MKVDCQIVEDLMPLYAEDLLQDETTNWLENHCEMCESCRKKKEMIQRPLLESVEKTIEVDPLLIKQVQFKLSIYQVLFVSMSFVFALSTSLLNNRMEFMLTYAILGFVLYLFYASMKMVMAISVIPIVIWSIVSILLDSNYLENEPIGQLLIDTVSGSLLLGMIHGIFALIGAVIGYFVHKWKEVE